MSNNEFDNLEQQLRLNLEKRPSARILQKLESRAIWNRSWQRRFFPSLSFVAVVSLVLFYSILVSSEKPLNQASHVAVSTIQTAEIEQSLCKAIICNRQIDNQEIVNMMKNLGPGSIYAWQRQAEFSGETFEKSASLFRRSDHIF